MGTLRVTVVAEYEPRLIDYPDCDTLEEAAAFDKKLLDDNEIGLDEFLDDNVKSVVIAPAKTEAELIAEAASRIEDLLTQLGVDPDEQQVEEVNGFLQAFGDDVKTVIARAALGVMRS